MGNIFITGVSSGIGLGLTKKYLKEGWQVYGLSRRECPVKDENLKTVQVDLSDYANVPGALFELLSGVNTLDVVVLNAGVLGEIADMQKATLTDLKKTMDINLWSNKVVLDWLFKHVTSVKQVIAVSSGAAVNGNKGWNGYSISKAAFNMMIKLYAVEELDTHFMSFAPGLVDTAMQDYLCSRKDTASFPSLSKIQSARGTENMPTPDGLADKLPAVFEKLLAYESGGFIDIRKM
ncbi:MAG: SDR family NAD(P)-dependent oxidoreductase [Lentisphaeraceae bacterium]|nr:SDR family NAD(P)-dependent oxidoreductase [Lentisphaeraceae bacterium]